MERATITIHGTGHIIIPDLSPGDMEFTIIRGPDGGSRSELAMAGSVGVSIHIEGLIGGHVDTTEGIVTDIIAATDMVEVVGIVLGIERANAIQIGMYITIAAQELNNPIT